jgi:Bardet-Biedl syndrome 9 protein
LRGNTTIKTCYEHKLVRNGFNFCLGRIGDRNYDIIFVQSIDGVISIFEQDSLVNSVAINENIFPGAISFLNRKDYFLISNTAYEVQCYTYNNLATVTSKSEDKKITNAWTVIIGELVKDVKIIDNTISKKQEILILSETMLHLLDDNGKFLFQKKLDYEPMAIHAFNIEDPNYCQNKLINMMYMISTNSDHILIYKGISLCWAVKIFDTSVFLKNCEFEGMKGLIVNLSDTGRLSVLYLGMEPVKNNKIIMPAKNLDYNVIAGETEKLLNIVENYEKGVVVLPNESLEINVNVDPNIYFDENAGEKIYYSDHTGKILRAQVSIELSFPSYGGENLKICLVCPNNIKCDEPMFSIEKLSHSNSPFRKIINFRIFSFLYPIFSTIKLYATYSIKNPQSGEKTIQSSGLEFDLPLALFIKTTSISKDVKHKITLCTDKDPLTIPKIFSDLTENFAESSCIISNLNMMGFIYPNKTEVSIIISKNAGRYRIQSSNYESLIFISNQIIMRLNEFYKYEISIYIEDDLNLEGFFQIMENHFKLFLSKKNKNEELEKYTSLYTVVQKNLLNKYKVT